jgi:hypothetical protein
MLALLFDMHGNLPALDAVLDDACAHGADRWLLGGDYAVFGGWPAETVARLNELPNAIWIRGNVDRWAATQAPDFELARTGVAACRQALDPDTLAALGALPESADLGGGTRAWHASPKSEATCAHSGRSRARTSTSCSTASLSAGSSSATSTSRSSGLRRPALS